MYKVKRISKNFLEITENGKWYSTHNNKKQADRICKILNERYNQVKDSERKAESI